MLRVIPCPGTSKQPTSPPQALKMHESLKVVRMTHIARKRFCTACYGSVLNLSSECPRFGTMRKLLATERTGNLEAAEAYLVSARLKRVLFIEFVRSEVPMQNAGTRPPFAVMLSWPGKGCPYLRISGPAHRHRGAGSPDNRRRASARFK